MRKDVREELRRQDDIDVVSQLDLNLCSCLVCDVDTLLRRCFHGVEKMFQRFCQVLCVLAFCQCSSTPEHGHGNHCCCRRIGFYGVRIGDVLALVTSRTPSAVRLLRFDDPAQPLVYCALDVLRCLVNRMFVG